MDETMRELERAAEYDPASAFRYIERYLKKVPHQNTTVIAKIDSVDSVDYKMQSVHKWHKVLGSGPCAGTAVEISGSTVPLAIGQRVILHEAAGLFFFCSPLSEG